MAVAAPDRDSFRYDPFSDEAMHDPAPLYRRLLADHRAYPLPQYNAWALSRFDDVWTAFLDSHRYTEAEGQVFSRELLLTRHRTAPEPRRDPIDLFNNLDPPFHSHVRRQMHRPLLPPAMARLEPELRRIVVEALDRLLPLGRFDVNLDLASHVSASAACLVVGLPLEEVPAIIRLVNRSVARAPGASGISADGWQAIGELQALLTELVAARRRGSFAGDGRMIDGLLGLTIGDRRISDEEVAQQLISIVIGGTESLPKVVAGGLLELWRHPDQRRRIAADPAALAGPAFEEMVRYCAPAQWFGRTLKRDATIAGVAMREAQRVILLVAAANRDPREFEAPEAFRHDRRMRRIVAFGMGPHFCIGMHVARLEGRLIVEELLRRVPEYEIDLAAGERAVSEFQIGWTRLPLVVPAGAGR